MRTYTQRLLTDAVERDDGMIIGPEHKKEWDEYKKWIKAGNKPNPAVIEPVYEKPKPTVEELQKELADIAAKLNELINN